VKDDYTKLKAYRSISLLSCMRMVIEKVVAELLVEEAERRGLLSDSHFGSRKRRSAIDAAANMVDRAHAVWTEGSVAWVILMDIKAAFPSVGRGRLVHTMKGKGIDGDLIRWTARFLSDWTVQMVIEGNVMERRPVEAGIPQGSPVSPILFASYSSGVIKWVEERVSRTEGFSCVHDVGWIATGSDVSQLVRKLESCAWESIDWAERQEHEFVTAKTEDALFIRTCGHKKHLRPTLTAKIPVGNAFVRFKKEATRWLGVWMDGHLTFKEHHNRCMKKARAAEVGLRSLTRTYGVVPACVRAVPIACIQAVALYGSELWCDPNEGSPRDDLHFLLIGQARSTLGALPTTPGGALRQDSGLTPAAVALKARQQRFVARLASACEASKSKELFEYPSPGGHR
jgi:hypothetical protein